MKIAVSGATGYIGGLLIDRLLKDGNYVLGITRKINDKINSLILKYPQNFSVCELISEDMSLALQNFMPEVVYSTTCCYETDIKFLEKTVESNYIFPSKLLKYTIHLNGGGRFVNIGTSLPPTLNLYSLTKKQFGELGKFYSDLGKIHFVNVLLESFYGQNEPINRFIPGSIYKFLNNVDINATSGIQKRDYVKVDDVIDVLVFLAKVRLQKNFASVPLGAGDAPQIKEILEYLKEIIGSKSRINFGAIPSRLNEPSTKADLSVLRRLGYSKQMTFWKDGLKELVEEIRNENIN